MLKASLPVLSSALLFAASVLAQAPETLAFSLDRPGPPVQRWTLTIDSTGAGSFTETSTPGAEAKAIHVGPENLRKLMAAIPVVEGGRCETHNKGIAKTGVKILHYTGPGHDVQCTYNYSDQERLNTATGIFEALAQTLEFGDRLRAKLRFDRLGLDSELELLQNAVASGNALEVGNIAPVLQAIVADERVIDHARRRAESLLTSPASTQAEAAPSSLR